MDERVPNAQPRLPVVINPIEHRANIVGTVLASLGTVAVVVLVLYGLSRPDASQQAASVPSQTTQTAPAGGSSGQSPQAAKPEPSTTGQGQGQGQGQAQNGGADKQPPNPGKDERSDSATAGAKPRDQPKPPQQ